VASVNRNQAKLIGIKLSNLTPLIYHNDIEAKQLEQIQIKIGKLMSLKQAKPDLGSNRTPYV
jgi:hypothetical protein